MENFGPHDVQNGTLTQMFRTAGIDDVRSYVDEVREESTQFDASLRSNGTPSRSKNAIGNIKQIYQLYKSLDKNGDGKITVEDVEILLKELGLGVVSKHLSRAIFDVVDTNRNGQLDVHDLVALTSILKRLTASTSSR